MRMLILTLCLLTSLLGCKSTSAPVSRTPDESHELAFDPFNERAIHAVLKKEPVPVPRDTAYASTPRQRQFFIEGFRDGWEKAISGALLHGTFGTPFHLPADAREAWNAGWKAGAKKGSERWLAESQKMRKRAREAR